MGCVTGVLTGPSVGHPTSQDPRPQAGFRQQMCFEAHVVFFKRRKWLAVFRDGKTPCSSESWILEGAEELAHRPHPVWHCFPELPTPLGLHHFSPP